MRVERELVVGVDERTALARADARLRRVGYHPDPREPGVYHRGSAWGSLFSSNPAGIQTTVTILTVPVEGGTRVRYSQDTELLGQILTRDDVLFWKGELDALSTEIRTGVPTTADMSLARRAAIYGGRLQMLSVFLPAPLAFLIGLSIGSPLAMLVLYVSMVVFCFVVGVGYLRRGMPPLHTLSVDSVSTEAQQATMPEEIPEDIEQMALDDFDRRLGESLGLEMGDQDDTEEAVKARLEQIAATVGRRDG